MKNSGMAIDLAQPGEKSSIIYILITFTKTVNISSDRRVYLEAACELYGKL